MKKAKRSIVFFVLAAVLCLAGILMTACGETTPRLVVEGQKEIFYIGDEFTVGDEFKVYLQSSDGTQTDVTANAEIKPESTLDMNTPGSYAVTVSYDGKKEIYYIRVNDFNNTLKKLSVNTDNAKLQYHMGESISYDGLRVIGTYENAQKEQFNDTITSYKDLKFKIVSKNGVEYEKSFLTEDDYTVTISKGAIATSYTVKVEGVNLASVEGALSLGSYFKKYVNAGASQIVSKASGWASAATVPYTYKFGDNYTYIKQDDAGSVSEYHCSLDESGDIDIVFFYEGAQSRPSISTNNLMEGVFYLPWYNDSSKLACGIEQLLTDLHEVGMGDPNKDFRESVNAATRKSMFAFGYHYEGGAFRNYYIVTEVEFTLGDTYYIESANVLQKFWFSGTNEFGEETDEEYSHFETDPETQITSPKPGYTNPDYTWEVKCTQEKGARTEKNPHISETKTGVIQSYKVLYQGNEVHDGDVIELDRGALNADGHSNQIRMTFTGIQPSDATFISDPLYVTDGTKAKEDCMNWFYGDAMYVIGTTGEDRIFEPRRGGTITLTFTTSKTEMKIIFEVTGLAPTSLTPKVYNTNSGFESTVSSKSVGVGETVYFTCVPDAYANGDFTTAVSSGSAQNVLLTPPKADATAEELLADPTLGYWQFKAAAAGTYTVKMTSVADSGVSATITFTVIQVDYAQLLNGTYTATDSANKTYTVAFAPTATGSTQGQVTITYGEDTSVYEYSVVSGVITLGARVDGTVDMGVTFTVDSSGNLLLNDKHSSRYALTKAE